MVRRTRLGSCAFGRGNGFIVARHRLPAGVDPDDMLWADDTFRPGAALGRGGNTGCVRRAAAGRSLRPVPVLASMVCGCDACCGAPALRAGGPAWLPGTPDGLPAPEGPTLLF